MIKRRWVFVVLGTFLAIAGFLQLIYTLYSGALIDEYYWIASVAANKNETISFIHSLKWYEVIIYLSYVGSSVYFIISINDFNKKYFNIACASFIIFTFIMIGFYGLGTTRVRQFNSIYPTYIIDSYLKSNNNLNSLIVKKPVKSKVEAPIADDIYLFLGESATKLRMSAYGYSSNTTPNLENGKWEKFYDYIANGLNTQPNLKALFSGKILTATQLVRYDIIRAAKGAGYKVIYVDNNKYQNVDPIYVISSQADSYISLNGLGATTAENDDRIKYDIDMDPYVKLAVSDPSRKLVIIHFAGSHPSQNKRYPSNFDVFGNAYDNSIAYTDHLLGMWADYIEDQSKNRSIVMFYVSDHGAKVPPGCGLGEILPLDYSSYGADDRFYSSIAVPFFVRFNASFTQKYRQEVERAMSHISDSIDHTIIFPTLAYLMGYKHIETYELERNIFSSNKNISSSRFNSRGQDMDLLIQQKSICANK